MATFVTGGAVLTPSGVIEIGYVVMDHGKIQEVGEGKVDPPAGSIKVEAEGLLVAPGFIDTHTHGINGHDAMAGAAGVAGMSVELAQHGVTGFLPTLVAAAHERLIELAAQVPNARCEGAQSLGIHLEGPYLDPRMPGMFQPSAFRDFSNAEFEELLAAAGGGLRLMTLACHGGRADAARRLLEEGVVPSLGHAAGDYEAGTMAFAAGVRRCTHCFNAMTGFHHRDPGILGAVLDRSDVAAELIFDGHHVHPAAASLLYTLKGAENTVLVTDSIVCAGYPDGDYEWAGYKITIAGGTARIPAGNLAGSVLTLDAAVRNAVMLLGVGVERAVEMASLSPARSVGLDVSKGSLVRGKDADMVLLDPALQPRATIVAGEVVWKA